MSGVAPHAEEASGAWRKMLPIMLVRGSMPADCRTYNEMEQHEERGEAWIDIFDVKSTLEKVSLISADVEDYAMLQLKCLLMWLLMGVDL